MFWLRLCDTYVSTWIFWRNPVIDGWFSISKSVITSLIMVSSVFGDPWSQLTRVVWEMADLRSFSGSLVLLPNQQKSTQNFIFLHFCSFCITYKEHTKCLTYSIFLRKKFAKVSFADLSWGITLKSCFYFIALLALPMKLVQNAGPNTFKHFCNGGRLCRPPHETFHNWGPFFI